MKNLLLFATLILFGLLTNAQTYNDESETQEEIVIEVSNATPMLFEALGITNQANPRSATLQGNNLFLRQVGEFNVANITTATEASDINVEQEGDNNNVTLSYRTRTAIAGIRQLGDENIVLDFVDRPGSDASIDLQQTGDGLRFVREGTNSITESLKFRQTEAAPTIIVRSFN